MSHPRISVAMTTYNGEKYLQEQLESLASQTYPPHELVVGDDGSSDGTIDILERFSKHSPFPVRIEINKQNLGYAENFFNSCARCSGDWIAFCDQDDVWLPKKLELCAIEIERDSQLNLILQTAELCDGDLLGSGRHFPNATSPGKYSEMSQFGFWVWLGFLQTVRASLVNSLDHDVRPDDYHPGSGRQSHDKWTCMIANALGGICILGEVVALYRRHDRALTGSYAAQSIVARIAKSQSTGSSHYEFVAGIARQSASALSINAGAADTDNWAIKLNAEALGFLKLANIYESRAKLYSSDTWRKRAKCYVSIWDCGGYIGPPFHALGWRSAGKDAAVVLLGGPKQKSESE